MSDFISNPLQHPFLLGIASSLAASATACAVTAARNKQRRDDYNSKRASAAAEQQQQSASSAAATKKTTDNAEVLADLAQLPHDKDGNIKVDLVNPQTGEVYTADELQALEVKAKVEAFVNDVKHDAADKISDFVKHIGDDDAANEVNAEGFGLQSNLMLGAFAALASGLFVSSYASCPSSTRNSSLVAAFVTVAVTMYVN